MGVRAQSQGGIFILQSNELLEIEGDSQSGWHNLWPNV